MLVEIWIVTFLCMVVLSLLLGFSWLVTFVMIFIGIPITFIISIWIVNMIMPDPPWLDSDEAFRKSLGLKDRNNG